MRVIGYGSCGCGWGDEVLGESADGAVGGGCVWGRLLLLLVLLVVVVGGVVDVLEDEEVFFG